MWLCATAYIFMASAWVCDILLAVVPSQLGHLLRPTHRVAVQVMITSYGLLRGEGTLPSILDVRL